MREVGTLGLPSDAVAAHGDMYSCTALARFDETRMRSACVTLLHSMPFWAWRASAHITLKRTCG
jgi:hypothetical protein